MRNEQAYYDEIKKKFAEEREIRVNFRPEGTAQFTSEFTGELEKYAVDPYAEERVEREPITDTVECLFIGGGLCPVNLSTATRTWGRKHTNRRAWR